MRGQPSLPVSIPLNLLPKKFVTTITKKSAINKGTMAPPESLKQNCINDAQLLVAFSEEPRAKVPVAPRPSATETTKDLRTFRKIAHVPEDLPITEPDPPIPARQILDLSIPGKVFCNKGTQTKPEITVYEYEMLEIIRTNNITRRQLLKFVGEQDVNNNKEAIIEIEENIPNEDIPEDIIAHSDFLKGLIMKNYKDHSIQEINEKYELITCFLTNGNINTNKDKISEQEKNTTNGNNQEQDVDVSPGSPPEIDICAGTSDSTSNLTVNSSPAAPAPQKTPAAPIFGIRKHQQMTAASHMMCILQLMNPAFQLGLIPALNTTGERQDAQREILPENFQEIRKVSLMIQQTLMGVQKILTDCQELMNPDAQRESRASPPSFEPQPANTYMYQDPVNAKSISLKAQKLLTELQQLVNPAFQQANISRNSFTPDAQRENLPENSQAASSGFRPPNQASVDTQQLQTNLHQLMNPALKRGLTSRNSFTPEIQRETLSENAQAASSGFLLPPKVNQASPDTPQLRQLIDPAFQQGSTSRHSFIPDVQRESLPENSQAASSNSRQFRVDQASSGAQQLPTNLQEVNPALKRGFVSRNFITPDAQRETSPENSQAVPSGFRPQPEHDIRQITENVQQSQQLSSNLQQVPQHFFSVPTLKPGVAVGNLPVRPALTYPNPALGYIRHHQQVFPSGVNMESHQFIRMQSPAPLHPFSNMERAISPSNFHSNNFRPTPTGMFQVCPNTFVGEGRHDLEQVGEQEKGEVPSKSLRGRGRGRGRGAARDTTPPMCRQELPYNYNKYQYLMYQQKIQEMERQQHAWKTSLANYPNTARGRQAN